MATEILSGLKSTLTFSIDKHCTHPGEKHLLGQNPSSFLIKKKALKLCFMILSTKNESVMKLSLCSHTVCQWQQV